MIIYNVTVKIGMGAASEWREWMLGQHIPDVMKTGCFKKYHFCRIIEEDDEAVTFAIQYFSENMAAFMRYQEEFAPDLQKEHSQKYEGQYVAFRTLLALEQSEEI